MNDCDCKFMNGRFSPRTYTNSKTGKQINLSGLQICNQKRLGDCAGICPYTTGGAKVNCDMYTPPANPGPLDFNHLANGSINITQGQSQIVLPESELIRLFGWYFELEDHNAVLELVEKIDK